MYTNKALEHDAQVLFDFINHSFYEVDYSL